MKTHIGMKGYYSLTLTSETTGEVREYEFDNLILDSGLDMYGEGVPINSCSLGADTIEPVVNQAVMNNILGASNTLQSQGAGASSLSVPPYYCSYTWQYRFIAGVATGNISQVAVGSNLISNQPANRRLFSLALIKDSAGNPITITKREDEVLDVRYTRQMFMPHEDVTGRIKIGNVDYDTIVRVANIGSWVAQVDLSLTGTSWVYPYRGEIGTVNQLPALQISASPTIVVDPYQTGSFKRKVTHTWGLNTANHADGIRSIAFPIAGSGNRFQIQYSRVPGGETIPKTVDNVLTLAYEVSWGRVNAAV